MGDINDTQTKRIVTLQFGEIEVEQKHIFKFSEGVFGFEDLREFVLISEEDTVPFRWLISLEKPEIGFPLLSPWHIDLNYNPGKDINLENEVIMVIITLENDKGVMTANMKAPVIMDVANQTGKQIILPSDKYSPNFVVINKNRT